MVIKILGSGCASCQRLEALARRAVEELGIEAEILKVTDYAEILAFGVMSTPALVVDDTLRIAGRLPSLDEMTTLLGEASA